MWRRLWNYLLQQGKDPLTWRGFVLTGTSLYGWDKATSEDHTAVIIFVGMFLTGLVSILAPPKKKEDDAAEPNTAD